jgi:hypothetical protein
MNNMIACSKFEKCSAPVCPLDSDWALRKHLDGERVCFYLSEYSKPCRDNLKQAIAIKLFQTIEGSYDDILTTYGLMKKRLNRSALTPSRLGGEMWLVNSQK